jgi:hypothetical protein
MAASADSSLALHGFQRFQTSRLLSLRFLETKIAEISNTIYRAGLILGPECTLQQA